jgi:hypothetical protein
MDSVLQVVSVDGFVLAENNDDHGLDPRTVFTAPADGTFIVRLFAFPAQPDSSIRFAGAETYVYRLTLTAGPLADHVFPLAVSRRSPGLVDAVGWNLPASARGLKVTLSDEDETTLFDPRLARPLRLRVEAHACVVEKEPNDRKSPLEVSLPVTVSGRIDAPGDVDVYRLAVKKGQALTVQVEARSLGFPLDPVLRLTDASGKTLLEQDDAGPSHDPSLAYTPAADGELRVEVRDLHGHGGPRYVYRVRIVLPEPSFALSLKAERFTAAAGKPLEVPVTVEARNGFAEEIEVAVEGLPQGISATPLKWKPGSGTAVVLKVTAAKGPVSTAFRIVGRAKGRSRPAAASGTKHLWLTVTR